jgi:NAD(P)-dependent dehydrogenase (short-subunit alcohol dehydrogenase family)
MTLPSYDFSGNVVIVTGGGTGIGAVIAGTFANSGAQVVIAARNAERLAERAAAIGNGCVAIPTDVTDEAQCQALIAETLDKFGRIDVLVNNAGGARHAPISKFRSDKWLAEFDLNLHSAFYCARAAAEAMIAAGSGSMVNISSTAGNTGTTGCAPYSAAKAGLQMFTRVAAAEWGPKGVRVNCVAAGMIATELAQANWAKTGFDASAAASGFPLRRPGTPEDIAQAVLFLASDGASYITGETLIVGGGPRMGGMIDV